MYSYKGLLTSSHTCLSLHSAVLLLVNKIIRLCALCSDGAVELDCLGGIQDKLTVNATDDSYQKARQNMAQAEEETRRRGAIVIKQRGRYISKRWGPCVLSLDFHMQEERLQPQQPEQSPISLA